MGAAFVAFLDHLVATLSDGPLVIVLDNVGYHKGRLAKDWWMAHHDRVRPLWQPTYAPQLNLMERVWGYRQRQAQLPSLVGRWASTGERHGTSALRTSRHGSTSLIRSALP